jgi:hypothetical protein
VYYNQFQSLEIICFKSFGDGGMVLVSLELCILVSGIDRLLLCDHYVSADNSAR